MMKRDRTVASGSTIAGGGAMLVSPSRVSETGCGTGSGYCDRPLSLEATARDPRWMSEAPPTADRRVPVEENRLLQLRDAGAHALTRRAHKVGKPRHRRHCYR